MTLRRGISLLDLIGLPPGSQSIIPDDIAAWLERFTVLDHRSATSAGTYIHSGTVQAIADSLSLTGLQNWDLQAPGLNTGLPFQLTLKRQPLSGMDNLEPAPNDFRLDLLLERVSITVPGLRPAQLVPGAGVTTAHLVPDTRRDRVRIVGNAVLRIASNPTGGAPSVRFIDLPDPFDPDAPTGAVFSLGFEPAHFFIGDSEIGLTVDRLTYDNSPEFTPAEIIARGQSAAWRGIAIKEATVFLPRNAPVVGDLSAGVRDVLLGSPLGLQGEIRIEFGRTSVNPETIAFFQQLNGTDTSLTSTGSERERQVAFAALPAGSGSTPSVARMRAAATSGSAARWTLPDGNSVSALETPYFLARSGETLRFQGVEPDEEGQPAVSPEVVFTFTETGSAVQNPPKINVTIAATTYNNVVSISGSSATLQGLTFQASPAASNLTWEVGSGSVVPTARGSSFNPSLPTAIGVHWLTLTDAQRRSRRVHIEVLNEGGLIVGTESGVFDGTSAVSVRDVVATYDLQAFHRDRQFATTSRLATLTAGSVSVPQGTIAEVTLALGTAQSPTAPPPALPTPEPIRHVQLLMDFNNADVLTWGDRRYVPPPTAGVASDARSQFQHWVSQFPGANFVVIGRCCDIGTIDRNRTLGRERAEEGQRLIQTAAGFNGATQQIYARGEQLNYSDAAGTGVENSITPALSADERSPNWLIKLEHPDHTSWGDVRSRDPRPRYRRVDVYAVGGTPASTAPPASQEVQTLNPNLRRSYVPGADLTTVQALAPREPDLPYRVRLVVKWDSPTVVGWEDAIPTQAEITIAWQSEPVTIPSGGGTLTPVLNNSGGTPPAGPEIFTFIGRWSYDARSGQTLFSLALNSAGDPNGLFYLGGDGSGASNVLAIALALGPALMARVSAASVEGAAVRIGALLAASTIAAAYGKNGKVIVFGIEIEQRQRALDTLVGSRQRLLFDYSVEIGFDTGSSGLPFRLNTERPMRVRYKKVGVELDNAREGLDRLGLIYEDVSFEIENPGQWTITGPLGELLRVTGSRAGAGSTWYEIDLAFALDLGVISISGATIRITFNSGSVGVELRGLAANVNVPGTLKGSGRLLVGDGGLIRAGIDVEVIPAQVIGRASLAMQGDFVALEVGVIFGVGIPLAASGLGLFGFIGRFVSNGTRDLSGTSDIDPVEREIQWYRKAPELKYKPLRGQWALGLGAAIGTLPDSAFTLNALGMLTVEFPNPLVVFGIDAKLISRPSLPAEQGSTPPPGSLTLLGIVAIDATAVKVGIRGRYLLPKVVDVQVPISGYFPYGAGAGDAYVRIGSDGVVSEGRPGDPVTVTFLPEILNVRSWFYLMVEARKLYKLGGDNRFNFDGFSIGFGSGWGIEWSAGPIRLSASAKVLVGLGTKPLLIMGGVFVRGELSLVVISISAWGEIILKLSDAEKWLDGKFCGKVDLFFFSIEGCVGLHIGDDFAVDIPVPDHPLTGVDLTDRRGIVTGRATPAADSLPNTVWVDTVPLLHFSHYVLSNPWANFNPVSPASAGLVWSGTSELKYAYRVVNVTINPVGGAPLVGPFEAAWWLPSHRGGVAGGSDPAPSSEEGRDLALFSWEPAPWARTLGEGGENAPGDPSHTIDRICDPAPTPRRICVLGQNAIPLDLDRVRLIPDAPIAEPFPSYFEILGRESLSGMSLEQIAVIAAEAGYLIVPSQVRSLPTPYVEPDLGIPLKSAYRLPAVQRHTQHLTTLQFDGQFAGDVVAPELVLAVCQARQQTGQTQVCDSYANEDPRRITQTTWQHGTLIYENLDQRLLEIVRVNAFPNALAVIKVRVRLPLPVTQVSVAVAKFSGQATVVEAFNGAGTRVAIQQVAGATNREEIVTVQGVGITNIVITSNPKSPILRVCYQEGVNLPVPQDEPNRRFPRVIGTYTDGTTLEWQADIIGKGADEQNSCIYVSYKPPKDGNWRSVRILPWRSPVSIINCCALSGEAVRAQQADQVVRDQLVNLFLAHPLNITTPPTPRPLLQPNTTYEIRVQCQWKGWRKTESQPQPPDVNSGAWTDFPAKVFTFKTAAETNPIPIEAASLIDETQFDPRGVARYLLRFEPGEAGFPHFLDDPIKVRFNVDYLEQLMAQYNRKLILKIRHTNPKAGSLTGDVRPPDVANTAEWFPLLYDLENHLAADTIGDPDSPVTGLISSSDWRVIVGAINAPCLDTPNIGGSTAQVTADLEPNAEYDLLLTAPPTATPESDQVLIARSHFRTSRYRNPADLLKALGFTNPDPYPILPLDALVTTALPTTAVLGNDQALEQTLQALGLDPWTLPDRPRTVTIWRNQSGWKLVGILLETDEALMRGNRGEVRDAQAGGVPFSIRRSNAATTRVLLVPPAPVSLTPADLLTLRFKTPSGTISGRRQLAGQPRIAYQEGV